MTEDINSSLTLMWQSALVGLTGIGAFGWAMYKYPSFRRNTIQNIFNGADYVYDTYHQWRYDDKVRETTLRTHEHDSDLVLSNSFHDEDENNKCGQALALRKDNHLGQLLEFFSDPHSLTQISFQEQNFYIVQNQKIPFKFDDIMTLPWLAVSLKVKTNEDFNHELDITEKWKQFWLKVNVLPFHLEYYDLWIREFYPDLEKGDIKDIELVVIDDMGEFRTYRNVLIKPHHDSEQVDLIPLNLKKKDKEIA